MFQMTSVVSMHSVGKCLISYYPISRAELDSTLLNPVIAELSRWNLAGAGLQVVNYSLSVNNYLTTMFCSVEY